MSENKTTARQKKYLGGLNFLALFFMPVARNDFVLYNKINFI